MTVFWFGPDLDILPLESEYAIMLCEFFVEVMLSQRKREL